MVQSAFIWFKQKVLERHTGVSPETYSKHRFDGVCSDLSSFYSLNPFIMQTPNGQCACLDGRSESTTVDTRHVSKPQLKFLDYIRFHREQELSKSLKLIHDLALYHSDVPFDQDQKSALFDLKILWEGLDTLGES